MLEYKFRNTFRMEKNLNLLIIKKYDKNTKNSILIRTERTRSIYQHAVKPKQTIYIKKSQRKKILRCDVSTCRYMFTHFNLFWIIF